MNASSQSYRNRMFLERPGMIIVRHIDAKPRNKVVTQTPTAMQMDAVLLIARP